MTPAELKRRRERMNLSQAELGLALDVPANTIARWERGVVEMRYPLVLRKLLGYLDEDLVQIGPDPARRRALLTTWLATGKGDETMIVTLTFAACGHIGQIHVFDDSDARYRATGFCNVCALAPHLAEIEKAERSGIFYANDDADMYPR